MDNHTLHDPDCFASVLVSFLPDNDNTEFIICFSSTVLNNDDFRTIREGLLSGLL